MITAEFDADKMMKTLKTLEGPAPRKWARQACRAGAKAMFPGMVGDAPDLSGATKAAMKVRAIKRSRVRIGAMITLSRLQFSRRTFFASFVELGWKTRAGKLGQAARHKVKGKRWMKNSFYKNASLGMNATRDKLAELINDYRGEEVSDVGEE